MQQWVRASGERVLLLFEGRDTAGKGGTIQRMRQHMNPRFARHVAVPAPSERESGQWFFQRYVEQLPARGEITFFDRSWYNRAGVERVMHYATDEQVSRFFEQVVAFEQFLVSDGIHLIKIWLSVGTRRTGPTTRRATQGPAEAMEAQHARRTSPVAVGGLHPRGAGTLSPDRHGANPVVVREQQQQAGGPAHHDSARADAVAVPTEGRRRDRRRTPRHRGAGTSTAACRRAGPLIRKTGYRSAIATKADMGARQCTGKCGRAPGVMAR